MDKLKLAKLLYLVERSAIERWGEPLFRDRYFCLKHGPVCTGALSGLDGEADEDVWEPYLTRSGNTIAAKDGLDADRFGQLSDAAIALVDDVHDRVGLMSTSEIRDYTHKLPEYRHTSSGRLTITDVTIARALGLRDPRAFARRMAASRKAVGARRP